MLEIERGNTLIPLYGELAFGGAVNLSYGKRQNEMYI